MNPLSKLILARKAELDLTWQEIADRGEFSSHSIVHALANKTELRTMPREATLRRLAKALDLPYDNVKQAALDACGLQVGEVQVGLADADTIRVIVAAVGEMDDRDKDKLRRLAEAFAAEARAARER